MTTRYITICACEKQLFRVGRISLRVPECTQVVKQRICYMLFHQNMLFLVFLILTIVKSDLLHIVITLHRGNLLSKRSKPRRHPSRIRGKSLFHLVICSFRVSSCDKKNLKWIFIPYDVLWNSLCVLYPLARGSGYKTHNSFHNTSYGMKIHLRSYIYDCCYSNWPSQEKKGRDLTQSYDKNPYTNRNVKRAKWQRNKKVRLNSGCGPTSDGQSE